MAASRIAIVANNAASRAMRVSSRNPKVDGVIHRLQVIQLALRCLLVDYAPDRRSMASDAWAYACITGVTRQSVVWRVMFRLSYILDKAGVGRFRLDLE
jgi:hypothetical protein